MLEIYPLSTGSPRVTTVPTYAVSRLRTRPIKWKMPLDTLPSRKTFTLMSRWFTFHLIPRTFYSLGPRSNCFVQGLLPQKDNCDGTTDNNSLHQLPLLLQTSTVYLSCLYYSSFSTILLIFTLIHVVWNCFLFF